MSNFEEYPLDANDVYVNGDPNLRYPQPPPSGGTDLDSLDLSTNESSDDDLFVTKEDGGTAWVKKSFLKIWNYIKTKIGISAQGSTGKYLDEQGNFTTPPNTTYGVVSKTANGLAPHLPDETTTTKYLRQDGMWAVPPDTKKGNGITTYAAKTGSGTTVTSTIVANTTMDNAIGTLLNNDVALNSALAKNVVYNWSLVDSAVTATATTVNTTLGRKFSKVETLCMFVLSGGIFRTGLTVPRSIFDDGNIVSLSWVNSANVQKWVEVQYVSDTSVKVQKSSNESDTTFVKIYALGGSESPF